MTTLYLALDRDGLTAPAGQIVGISGSAQGLIDAGFPAATYTGDRVATVESSDDTKWDDECQPGWYYLSASLKVQRSRPASELELLKSDAHRMLTAGDIVRAEIQRLSIGQDLALVTQAHTWMWRARGGSYLILRDTQYTIAQRRAWCNANRAGPTDIVGSTLAARVLNYFTHFTGVTPVSWIAFANPADATRFALANSMAIDGTIDASVDLVDREWVNTLQPGTGD